jgi:hypothetical protein
VAQRKIEAGEPAIMAAADAYKVETGLKKIMTAISELAGRMARLESRVSAVEKSQERPKSN